METTSKDYQAYLFHQGTLFSSYDFLGAHEKKEGAAYVRTFRTWAPSALSVSLISDRSGWGEPRPMKRITSAGVWETELEDTSSFDGVLYKFAVTGKDGETRVKNDPYAFRTEKGGGRASVVYSPGDYPWGDGGYLRYRRSIFDRCLETGRYYSAPLNIYEVHLGSFITRDGACTSDGEHYAGYRQIADRLCGYAKKLGYTHVELLPVMEHPYDGSWGYQITGYYSPTSRFGSPDDFRYFVDRLHRDGVGVILDWVPAHFPKDACGLCEFDGSPEYEYQGADRMENKGWGTRFFDVGRPEVQSFLISNALFWFREYHVDGLRADAVSSMLYLDYDRGPGEWVPGELGDNRNTEAIAFFKKLNTAVFAEFPDALMIAEESTAWEGVTRPASKGGLGFNFKWNMGFSNDVLSYVSADPYFRCGMHGKITFPLVYAFSENFILPVSHDEVVHGKGSLIGKMFGEYDEKFATLRTFFTYMMTVPGKKLTFMGCEYAQFREWDYENELEWFMLDFPRHRQTSDFVAELNAVYLCENALWEIEDSWQGFEWVDVDSREDNAAAYTRRSADGELLLIALNFSRKPFPERKIGPVENGEYRTLINTDDVKFGGTGEYASVGPIAVTDNSLTLKLGPLSGVILKKYPAGGGWKITEVGSNV